LTLARVRLFHVLILEVPVAPVSLIRSSSQARIAESDVFAIVPGARRAGSIAVTKRTSDRGD
jgi:hypothetical protein